MNIFIHGYNPKIPEEAVNKIAGINGLLVSRLSSAIMDSDIVIFNTEIRSISNQECRIDLICAEDGNEDLGKSAQYDRCIFSHFRENIGNVTAIPNVIHHEGYLALDPDVKSEIFCELELIDGYNIIINVELSTLDISDKVKSWFESIVDEVKAVL